MPPPASAPGVSQIHVSRGCRSSADAGEVHLVLDNYGTHKTPQVIRWFARHPRYRLHFTPASGSWVNQVERWFAQITDKRIRRGSFKSVQSLEKAIREYPDDHNEQPRPFVWTADADLILGKIQRHCERISNSGHQLPHGTAVVMNSTGRSPRA
jgi:transposase